MSHDIGHPATTGYHINPLNTQINPHSVAKPVTHDMVRHVTCVLRLFIYFQLLNYIMSETDTTTCSRGTFCSSCNSNQCS